MYMGIQKFTICLEHAVARNPDVRLNEPVSLDFKPDEHIAIVGPNGAGKTLLVELLTGKQPLYEGCVHYDFRPAPTQTVYNNIKSITFRDSYGSADANYYYQQRWNVHDQKDISRVRDLLGPVKDEEMKQCLFDIFRIWPLLDKHIIMLSSGELRKYQLAKMLLANPRILFIDNPFIGLDAQARALLFGLLGRLSSMDTLQIVLVLSTPDDIPPFITHVVPVAGKVVGKKVEHDIYMQELQTECGTASLRDISRRIIELPYNNTSYTSDEVVRMNKVSIRYEDHVILKDLDWTVMRGEKWALSGENGSGKSTLLSLVCADNPQSYACDISLFGHKRGSGESIWEIKQHIGYVSPEMHRAYLKNLPAVEIVASGLHDSIGLYIHPDARQLQISEWWMDIFGVMKLRNRSFMQLSSGEQRLCLLARAFVKDPELLILDEPLHGLDKYNRHRVKQIIESFCQRHGKTLIMVTHYENEFPECIDHRLQLSHKCP